jgi:hypothetical protein
LHGISGYDLIDCFAGHSSFHYQLICCMRLTYIYLCLFGISRNDIICWSERKYLVYDIQRKNTSFHGNIFDKIGNIVWQLVKYARFQLFLKTLAYQHQSDKKLQNTHPWTNLNESVQSFCTSDYISRLSSWSVGIHVLIMWHIGIFSHRNVLSMKKIIAQV